MASTQTQPLIEPQGLSGLAPSTGHKSELVDAHLEVQNFRDSRLIDCQTPIPEEDENNETASEPPEPVTPTSDTSPHPFDHDGAVDVVDTAAAEMPRAETKLRPLTATLARPKPTPRSQTYTSVETAQQPRQGLGKRVGSFVRNKLHRTPSAEPPQQLSVTTTDVSVSNNENSNGNALMPKTRRMSSFSLSGRNTPKSSQSNTPPSPSSPSSTISHDPARDMEKSSKHSQSSTALNGMNSPRQGITFPPDIARGGSKSLRHPRRERSASTDHIPHVAKDDNTVGLTANILTQRAAEGVGMKARRLSTSLPNEFNVDHVDLDKEFKSSSLMPGKRGKLLGKGATAQVRIMARKEAANGEEQLVAVKEFRNRERNESEDDYIKKIKSEYCIAKSLHHPNIVETVRLCYHNGKWNHVMEYCNYGEIYSLVDRKLFASDGYYSQTDRLCLFKQLIRGVDYLHSHGIAHRDIKLENLLLNKDGHLKISDFGVAEVFSGEHPGLRAAGGECGKNMGEVRLSASGICGSMPYIAPEVLIKGRSYDPRPLDVWSCAIVYLTMTCGGCPWDGAQKDGGNYDKFEAGWTKWLENHPDGQLTEGDDGYPKCGMLFGLIGPPPIKRLLLKMLHPIPEKRIPVRDIVKLSYFKNIECCCPDSFEDQTCCIDVSQAKKGSSKMMERKKHLHRHIPPKPERRVAKALQHRFDMGEGWN